uniref:Glutaredoxin domain-containing protein n=1 Tax=Heterorhabditis bacteriophora TaxID=37862 RepID=A0A1I7XTB2_HETBA
MISLVLEFFANYGWFITFIVIFIYSFYYYVFGPKLEQMRKARETIKRKKFDEHVHSKVADHIVAVREKQQLRHNKLAEELKRKEEETRQIRMRLLDKKIEDESIPKHALGRYKLGSEEGKKDTPGDIIDRFIASKPVIVFSKSWCPFCRKAKSALAIFRLQSSDYEYIELDERPDLPENAIQDEFQKRYGSRSVPKVKYKVFVGRMLIGGGDDTVQLLHEGKLETLVRDAINKFGVNARTE